MSKKKLEDMLIELALKVVESQSSNFNALLDLKYKIKNLEEENKKLREYLGVESVEEKVEGGFTNKIIRKIK
jgi:hypothetical protein